LRYVQAKDFTPGMLIGQDYGAFTGSSVDWNGALAAYCGIPLFLVCYLGFKIAKKTKLVPLKECDFSYKD